jgi:hypothetical protein
MGDIVSAYLRVWIGIRKGIELIETGRRKSASGYISGFRIIARPHGYEWEDVVIDMGHPYEVFHPVARGIRDDTVGWIESAGHGGQDKQMYVEYLLGRFRRGARVGIAETEQLWE